VVLHCGCSLANWVESSDKPVYTLTGFIIKTLAKQEGWAKTTPKRRVRSELGCSREELPPLRDRLRVEREDAVQEFPSLDT
jgi:hypothetical protein